MYFFLSFYLLFSGDNSPAVIDTVSAAGRYYLRTADEDREVTPAELKQFFIANEYKEKWEKTKTDVLAKNIDKQAIKTFCSNVLFGNTKPVTLKTAIFATDEKLTFLDMQMYEDNIFNLLNTAEMYILKNIRWKTEIVGADREEIPEIPVAVIREVLANSFAHAVYNGNTYLEICIHPDKITIYSPGTYVSSYKPEDYITKNLPSSIRNATISKVLYLNKSIEQFGSGFKRINSLCKDTKIRYSYQVSDFGFTFIIYRNTESSAKKINDNDVTANVTVNVTLNKTYIDGFNIYGFHKGDYLTIDELVVRRIQALTRMIINNLSEGFTKKNP